MKRLKQCLLLITILGGLSISEAYAQKNNFANLARYAKENAALPKPVKKEKRVVFMGNSITEGWVRTHPDFFKTNGYIAAASVDKPLINSYCVSVRMLLIFLRL